MRILNINIFADFVVKKSERYLLITSQANTSYDIYTILV